MCDCYLYDLWLALQIALLSMQVFPCGCTLKKSLKLSPSRPQGWNHRWFLENDLGTEGNHYCHGDSLWGRKEGEKYLSFPPSVFPSFFFLKTEWIAGLCCITYSSSVLFFSFFAVLSLWQNLCWKKYHFSHSSMYERVNFQITAN